MAEFPHLRLYQRIKGTHKPPKTNIKAKVSPTTAENLQNRAIHSQNLLNSTKALSESWESIIEKREIEGLPNLPNPKIVPVFLKTDPAKFNIESLKGFGIEIISEEEDGFIIGASGDNFKSLQKKINEFLEKDQKKGTALIWNIDPNPGKRFEIIVSEELKLKWDQIKDTDEFYLDIGIASYIKTPVEPTRTAKESAAKFSKKHKRWKAKFDNSIIAQSDLSMERQEELEKFIELYDGEIIDNEFVEFDDSFCCRIRINGVGLKDLVLTYQYLFEVTEYDSFSFSNPITGAEESVTITLDAPHADSPKICVIDSGINDGHRLLAPAILNLRSKSYVPNDSSTADGTANGGHGIRVAGAILYSSPIPKNGNYQLPFFILNARVLDNDNAMSSKLYPPVLMETITIDFDDAKIFNLSINSFQACRTTHMSQWASMIDKLMYEEKLLFIISTGNLNRETNIPTNPGIKDYLNKNINYPAFLLESASRIANPAQSCFALTVGSVCIDQYEDDDLISFGKKEMPSSFTRTGLGLWGMIKPDVVEFGGDWVREKIANPNLSIKPITSPELIKNGLTPIGRDDIGTSFAAPKVTHIAGHLLKAFPNESVLMYRALIAQSARLPLLAFERPSFEHIKYYGYGIPDLKRATENSQRRITFIADGIISAKQANTYRVKIPQELNRPGFDYKILIEVTLSYFAKPRRTRKGTRSYLSTWLDWESSKFNETYDVFSARVVKDIEVEDGEQEDVNTIQWKIRERKDWGDIKNVKRNDSTLQKDWTIIESNRLPDEFCLAVIGHKGWENKLTEEIPYALTVSFEILTPEAEINIYQLIQSVNIIEVEQQVEIN